MELGELIAEFRLRTGDTEPEYLFSDAQVISYANRAENEAAVRAKLLFDQSTIDIVADQSLYTLDPLIFDIESAVLKTLPIYDGSEVLSSTAWSLTAGWAESPATVFAHTSGTTALSHSSALITATKYRLQWTITGRTTGSVSITTGGYTKSNITATGSQDFTAVSASTTLIIPTTDFNGTLSLMSIKSLSTDIIKSELDLTDRPTISGIIPGWRASPASKPLSLIREGKKIEIYPIPNANFTLDIYYYRLPLEPMAGTGDEPEIATIHHDGLTDWMIHCAAQVKDIDTESLTIEKHTEASFIQRFGIRDDANVARKKARRGNKSTKPIRF